jgi:hypothetical protein
MDAFVPDISQLWLAEQETTADDCGLDGDDDTASSAQREALEQLNERVYAARCVY